jgi:hypothetical protein
MKKSRPHQEEVKKIGIPGMFWIITALIANEALTGWFALKCVLFCHP